MLHDVALNHFTLIDRSTFPEDEVKERGKNDTPMFFPNAARFDNRGREMGRVMPSIFKMLSNLAIF